jgi:hypothetical protein
MDDHSTLAPGRFIEEILFWNFVVRFWARRPRLFRRRNGMAALGEPEEVEEFVDLPDFANAKNRALYSQLKEVEKVRRLWHLHRLSAAAALGTLRWIQPLLHT